MIVRALFVLAQQLLNIGWLEKAFAFQFVGREEIVRCGFEWALEPVGDRDAKAFFGTIHDAAR